MNDPILIAPKGPDAIRLRMMEIRTKMGIEDPRLSPDFDKALNKQLKTPDGPIRPFNPLAGKFADIDKSAFRKMAQEAATKEGIEPELFDSLIEVESGYDPASTSRVGAIGLSQLMPATAHQLGVTDPFDPQQNLMAGAKYLRQMLDKFNGNKQLALAAYNAGPGRVQREGGIPAIDETQQYVQKVLSRYNVKRQP